MKSRQIRTSTIRTALDLGLEPKTAGAGHLLQLDEGNKELVSRPLDQVERRGFANRRSTFV